MDRWLDVVILAGLVLLPLGLAALLGWLLGEALR